MKTNSWYHVPIWEGNESLNQYFLYTDHLGSENDWGHLLSSSLLSLFHIGSRTYPTVQFSNILSLHSLPSYTLTRLWKNHCTFQKTLGHVQGWTHGLFRIWQGWGIIIWLPNLNTAEDTSKSPGAAHCRGRLANEQAEFKGNLPFLNF